MLSNVLIAGYTDFITSEFLTTAFPDCRIVIAGTSSIKESFGKVSRFDGELSASACHQLFHTYDFGQVVYVSRGAAPLGTAPGEEIDILSNLISASYPETRLLYISGPEHLAPSPLYLREICRRPASGIPVFQHCTAGHPCR